MSYKKIFLILTLITLMPRLGLWTFAWISNRDLALDPQDSLEYVQTSANLFKYGVLAQEKEPPLTPDGFRTPIYPVFLYFASFGLLSLKIVSIIQYVLVLFSAFLLYLISLKIFENKRIALATSILFTLEPFLIFWSGTAMSDTLFLFLLILAAYLTYHHSNSLKILFLSGFIFGLASLTRPILFPFFFLSLPLIGYHFFRHGTHKKILFSIALYMSGFIVIVFPWMVRNKINFDSWNISSVGLFNFYFYDTALVLSRETGTSMDTTLLFLKNHLGYPYEAQATFRNPIHQRLLLEKSIEVLKAQPLAFLKVRVFNIAALTLNDGYHYIGRFLNKTIPTAVRKTGMAFWFVQYLAIAMFVLQKFKHLDSKKKVFYIFLCFAIFYFSVVTGAVSSARYRVPIMGFIFLLSVPGFHIILEKIKKLIRRV